MALSLLDTDKPEIINIATKSKIQNSNDAVWTTVLQILLPLAALTILWGRQGVMTRFLLQFKKSCTSALCQSLDKRPPVYQWVNCHLKPTWFPQITPHRRKTIDFWKDGSLLCSLINSAIPGACFNPHRHWNERPSHGQALAYKYLDVNPVFTEEDFKNERLSLKKEEKFQLYLLEVQKLVEKICQREIKYSSQCVARGMGLISGEQFRKSTFYIYYNSFRLTSKSDVVISVFGPYGTYCSRIVPATYDSKQTEQQRLAYISKAQKSFFRSFSIDLGSFVSSSQKEVTGDIPIKIVTEKNRIKVVFIPQTVGMHKISIITNGFHLVGSPFLANILSPSSCLIDSFKYDIEFDNKTCDKRIKRKVLSRIIDCIDEQISLNDSDLEFNETSETGSARIQRLSVINEIETTPSTINDFTEQSTVTFSKNETAEIQQKTTDYHLHEDNFDNSNIKGDTIGGSQGFKLSQNTLIDEVCLESFETPKDLTDGLEASPICEIHIDPEVTKQAHIAPIKLTRQRAFYVEEPKTANFALPDTSSSYDIDKEFEKLFQSDLELSKDTSAANDTYLDSYITVLDPKPDLPANYLNSTLSYFEDDLACQNKLNVSCPKKFLLRTRRSLPNILAPSSLNQISTSEFRAKFQECQRYWRNLSSTSIDSDLSLPYNELRPKTYPKISDSLPNLSDLRERILNESNLNCDYFSDFYSSLQADEFRTKFLQCRSYWETLSTQNFSTSTEVMSENDIDSGYYASLPNLSPAVEDETNLFKQYKEKRRFWEQLSLEDSKWRRYQQPEKKWQGRKADQETKPLGKMTSNKCEKVIYEHDEEEEILENKELNLTDDVKQMSNSNITYYEARNFFKGLEEGKIKKQIKSS